MDWHWFLKTLTKSAVLGGPAIATLVFWMKRGVRSRTFYRASWANPFALLLWLILVAIGGWMNQSADLRGWIPSSLPGNVFFAFPFLFVFCSLALCLGGFFLKSGQRGFAVFANALMFVLWLSVTVSPN